MRFLSIFDEILYDFSSFWSEPEHASPLKSGKCFTVEYTSQPDNLDQGKNESTLQKAAGYLHLKIR